MFPPARDVTGETAIERCNEPGIDGRWNFACGDARNLADGPGDRLPRLALIDRGECVPRFDNESGKRDHRHRGTQEVPYRFTTIERLLKDFDADTWDTLDEQPDHR